jgi:trehalose-phosphatase
LLERAPLGVFSDIDGTLSPIVPWPEDARISEKCRSALAGLIERGTRVALITGRSLEDARAMGEVEGAVYAASHGFELFIDGVVERPVALEPYVEAARRVLKELSDLSFEGLSVEDKGAMVALHYRNAPDQIQARSSILEAVSSAPSAAEFQVQENRKVIELRPSLPINKGSALDGLVRRLDLRSVLCLGDDRTDVDMFQAAKRWRAEGNSAGIVAVNSPEVVPDLIEAADYTVEGVPGVEWLLEELLTASRQ